MGFSNRFMPLKISPRMRLDDVVKRISDLPFEGTDCALPMIWAREHKLNVSAFITYRQQSVVSTLVPEGGNARLLKDIPVRIFIEPDIAWRVENWNQDV